VHVTLKTDDAGRVRLGPLPDIVSVTAEGAEDTEERTWNLVQPANTYYGQVNGREGDTLVLPYSGEAKEASRDAFSLLELRAGTFAADRFETLSLQDGLLRIAGLPAGDYDLWLKRPNVHVRLRVAAGRQAEGYVLGAKRLLEVRGARPLQIASLQADDQTVTIRLQNATEHTRVHLFATRYQPAYSAFDDLSQVRDCEPAWVVPKQLDTLYVAGRNIGDEYRYIIDRKYATKYPGNMLNRPSLLLNPWAVRSTETAKQEAAEGESFGGTAEKRPAVESRARRHEGEQEPASDFANLDFLAQASAVLVNLVPDEHGIVSVPREQIGAHQALHVVAVDPLSTAYRALSLREQEMPMRDLRLQRGLDPEKHYTQQKQITAIGSGKSFVVSDITSSRFELYDSLSKVYSLYMTLSEDATLDEFGFITHWPDLSHEEKREKYSKYACHELNFFLYQKDPEFFRDVIRPYLQNKKELFVIYVMHLVVIIYFLL